MKLRDDFLVYPDGDQTILVPVSRKAFSGIVKANKTTGFIFECLSEDVSEAEIIRRMLEKYDGTEEEITADVKKVLAELRRIGAIAE